MGNLNVDIKLLQDIHT